MAAKGKTGDGGEGFAALAAQSISTGEFAELAGISAEALRLRIASGEIPKEGHGKLNLVAAVQGFFRGELARLKAAQIIRQIVATASFVPKRYTRELIANRRT